MASITPPVRSPAPGRTRYVRQFPFTRPILQPASCGFPSSSDTILLHIQINATHKTDGMEKPQKTKASAQKALAFAPFIKKALLLLQLFVPSITRLAAGCLDNAPWSAC